jgi:diguanylate cyclase (GGDEF)-like protein
VADPTVVFTALQTHLLLAVLTDPPGPRSARKNWTAFEIDNSDSRSDLEWLKENRYLSVVNNECRLTLLALAALAKMKKALATHLYGLCDAVLGCVEALVRQQPPQPGQRFEVELIARRMPPNRPQDIQELLTYFYNTDVLVPTGGSSVWAPEAVTLGSDFTRFVGKELDDVVQVLWEERARSAQLRQPQVPPRRKAPHKILDDPDHIHEDLKEPCGVLGRAVLFVDIDDFKQYNTKLDHGVVDELILKPIQRSLLEVTGSLGHVYRFAGDEFMILLQHASEDMAIAFAETLRRRVEGMTFLDAAKNEHVTVTIGVAHTGPTGDHVKLQARANKAENQLKQNQKNCVAIWTPSGYCVVGQPSRGPSVAWKPEG